jgi:hypothetical protein
MGGTKQPNIKNRVQKRIDECFKKKQQQQRSERRGHQPNGKFVHSICRGYTPSSLPPFKNTDTHQSKDIKTDYFSTQGLSKTCAGSVDFGPFDLLPKKSMFCDKLYRPYLFPKNPKRKRGDQHI